MSNEGLKGVNSSHPYRSIPTAKSESPSINQIDTEKGALLSKHESATTERKDEKKKSAFSLYRKKTKWKVRV